MGTLKILIDIPAATRAGAADGLNLIAERVRALAVPLTPMELGDLRSSLTVHGATESDLESAVTSGLVYAPRHHEDLSLRHKRGGAKYLEGPALEVGQSEAGRLMAAAVRKALT